MDKKHYSHPWQEGDFIVMDNMALAHRPAPAAFKTVEEVGLRILHRTSMMGYLMATKIPWNTQLTKSFK